MLRRELTEADKQFGDFVKNEVHPLVPEISDVKVGDEPDPVAMHCVEMVRPRLRRRRGDRDRARLEEGTLSATLYNHRFSAVPRG